jgi:hypothetical protein
MKYPKWLTIKEENLDLFLKRCYPKEPHIAQYVKYVILNPRMDYKQRCSLLDLIQRVYPEQDRVTYTEVIRVFQDQCKRHRLRVEDFINGHSIEGM